MQLNLIYNHHAKCEKLALTNLTFADDILLFCRGDQGYVDLMMGAFKKFTSYTGIIVNIRKCIIFFGSVDHDTRERITEFSRFIAGHLCVKYLGGSSYKQKTYHSAQFALIDRIIGRIRHWSTSC